MKRLRIGLFAGAGVLAAGTTLPQEITYLDLIDPLPRERVHSPQGGIGGGECVFSGSSPTSDATITLVTLDKGQYSIGEDVTFEAKIQNSGKEKIEMPWTPHLGDLEPADSTKSYAYLQGAVALKFTDPIASRSFSVYANFYGSPDVPGSTRELLPGQSILVRVRRKIDVYEEWWWRRVKESPPLTVNASANFLLNRVTYSPNETQSSGTDISRCTPLRTTEANQLEVALWPRKSD
jgi:hypothetical protein